MQVIRDASFLHVYIPARLIFIEVLCYLNQFLIHSETQPHVGKVHRVDMLFCYHHRNLAVHAIENNKVVTTIILFGYRL